MATKSLLPRRRPGRPLPITDPDAPATVHRLTTMGDIGVLLRSERAARGLSQADMAARLGVSRQTLVGLEAGGTEGTAAGTLLRILTDLGVVLIARPARAAAGQQPAFGLSVPRHE
jgi:ribosome-binding protein aMBF1 (putative translation factor)